MPKPLVANPDNIRLAMLGMVEGNGHPFSWSAITNGRYDRQMMARCGYPVISEYLDAQPPQALGIPGAQVTHVWCDQPDHSRQVAAAAHIPCVVERPQDVIGKVDAVVIATDVGSEHVQRVRPFLDAGLPAFIDKPLADNRSDLHQFITWRSEGKHFISTSCMRYAREFAELRRQLPQVGEIRAITVMMAKSWERYGIHALEAVYPLLPPGEYEWAVNTGDERANVVHLRHRSGTDVILVTTSDLYGAFSQVQVAGTKGVLAAKMTDTFYAFKSQLQAFVSYLRTGVEPVAFDQTCEQMAIIIAGLESRARGGVRVPIQWATA